MNSEITIKLRFFASFREKYELSDEVLTVPEGCTIQEAWELILPGEELPERLLVAVNDEYSQLDQSLTANDEVAFFPPVTGG